MDLGNVDQGLPGVAKGPGPFNTAVPPKVGARFSTAALRALKNWLSAHEHNPYPRTKDIDFLERQTGLTKVQITNWFGNARRRTKTRIPIRPTSPGVPKPRNIPVPPPSASLENMDPLQRWRNSPPEDEPADVSAILEAVSQSSTSSRPGAAAGHELPQPSVWGEWSSASSAAASSSGRSSGGSTESHMSASSRGSSRSIGRWSRHRRRKNVFTRNPRGRVRLTHLPSKYQCTFCTESFDKKHTWQRHEKTMHLTLERWECSPQGPFTHGADGVLVCVFCGMNEPDDDHPKMHGYDKCREKPAEQRCFLRRDHLVQHLRVVHDTKLENSVVEGWKVIAQDVRSRCGFCDIVMNCWKERADHIAEHFQTGKTMAEWHGDWGFDEVIAEMVDNSIPPYLIELERTSPWPFTTERGPPATPPNAFELIKLELEQYALDFFDANSFPATQDDLLYESCCVIMGADSVSSVLGSSAESSSWLRDLLVSSPEILQRALDTPLSSVLKGRVTELRINGKVNIFDECGLEGRLLEFSQSLQTTASPLDVSTLQQEAQSIVERFDSQSKQPSELFVAFLTGLINASTLWLLPFQQRAGLLNIPDDSEFEFSLEGVPEGTTLNTLEASRDTVYDIPTRQPIPDDTLQEQHPLNSSDSRPPPLLSIDTYYWGLRRGLARYVAMSISPRNPQSHIPTDEELQYQARLIMFESEDPWNQTPADNPEWLTLFKRDNGITPE